jgi:hypothetical protein
MKTKFKAKDKVTFTKESERVMSNVLKKTHGHLVGQTGTIVKIAGDNGIGETLYLVEYKNQDREVFAETHLKAA